MSKQVKISNLSAESTEDSLRDFFSFCGDIQLIQLYPGSHDNNTLSHAIIVFETDSGASTAVLLDNAVVDGTRIRVEAIKEGGDGAAGATASAAGANISNANGSVHFNNALIPLFTLKQNTNTSRSSTRSSQRQSILQTRLEGVPRNWTNNTKLLTRLMRLQHR